MTQEERDIARDNAKDYHDTTCEINGFKSYVNRIKEYGIESISLRNKEQIRFVSNRSIAGAKATEAIIKNFEEIIEYMTEKRSLIYKTKCEEKDLIEYEQQKARVTAFDEIRSRIHVSNVTLKQLELDCINSVYSKKQGYIELPEELAKEMHEFMISKVKLQIESMNKNLEDL